MIVAHNLLAMNAQRQYGVVTDSKKKSTEKLSSGYRINRAADDAAGLTISEKMRSQIRGLNMGSSNIQEGISLIQVADGALSEVNDMLHRMTELSIQSANGTNTNEDRQAIQQEINEIVKEIDRIKDSTEYNTMPIFDDMYGIDVEGSVTNLVSSPSADKGYLSEAYLDNGNWYSSSSLDFSNVNSKNINKLNGAGFGFNCSQNCSEAFSIEFRTDGTPSSASNLSGSGTHKYIIDIKDCKNGSDVVNAIFGYVSNNLPTTSHSGNSISGGLYVSHSNVLVKDGNTLHIVGTSSKGSKENAETYYSTRYNTSSYKSGAVNCSDLANIISDEKINTVNIQCSNNVDDFLSFDIPWMNSTILGINGLNVANQSTAKSAINTISKANDTISSMRSELGAAQNRLEHAYNNNTNKAENTTAAESRIRDTDMAEEMMKLTKENILAQASEAMMAQANQSTQGVLNILGS